MTEHNEVSESAVLVWCR